MEAQVEQCVFSFVGIGINVAYIDGGAAGFLERVYLVFVEYVSSAVDECFNGIGRKFSGNFSMVAVFGSFGDIPVDRFECSTFLP